MKLVVIPAANETTRVPGLSESLISPSTIAMSCGFTTKTTVSALAETSWLVPFSTPCFAVTSADLSIRRSAISNSDLGTPARNRPESKVSPITPAPIMAVVITRS